MKKQINDLLFKMQSGENCIGETSNSLEELFNNERNNAFNHGLNQGASDAANDIFSKI